jgi:putative resolvase
MCLREWASHMGFSYRTAWRMVKARKLPKGVQSIQFPTGTIRILKEEKAPTRREPLGAVIYARINSRSEEANLEEQSRICTEFCRAQGWQVESIVRERAPGFGPKRRRMHTLLPPPPGRLEVARSSVISRFDLTVTELLLRNLGCQLVIINQQKEERGMGGALEDLTDAISSTCHLHYGLKRGRALVEDLNRVIDRGNRLR